MPKARRRRRRGAIAGALSLAGVAWLFAPLPSNAQVGPTTTIIVRPPASAVPAAAPVASAFDPVIRASTVPTVADNDTESLLKVEAGVAGVFNSGVPVVARVSVGGSRLIKGTLTVFASSGGGQFGPTNFDLGRTAIDVEVPAGSVKTYYALLPTMPGTSARISTSLKQGEQTATESVNLSSLDERESIGVLAGFATRLPRLPENVPLKGDFGSAAFGVIGSEILQLGPLALSQYDVVVADAAELAGLSPVERAALFGWTSRGGRLLLDDPPGPVATAPPEWKLGSAPLQLVDAGEVQFAAGAAQAGRWADILSATKVDSAVEDNTFFGGIATQTFFPFVPLSATLSQDAGFKLPELPWLLTLVGAYIIVTGPLIYFGLRRFGRTTLWWVSVPLVSLAFTGLVALLGNELRDQTQAAHETLIESTRGGSFAVSHQLIGSRSGGEAGVRTPPGWSVAPFSTTVFNSNPFGSGGVSSAGVTLTRRDGRATAALTLQPGSFAQVDTAGPLPPGTLPDQPLAVTAEAGPGGTVKGTVTNNLKVALEDVGVFINGDGKAIGRLEAGESRPFEMSALTPLRRLPFGGPPSIPEASVWPEALSQAQRDLSGGSFASGPVASIVGPSGVVRVGGVASNSPPSETASAVNIALWAEWVGTQTPSSRVGQAIAVGWTRELPAPVTTLGGRAIRKGRTGIVARAGVTASPAVGAVELAIRREVIRGVNATKCPSFDVAKDNNINGGGPVGPGIGGPFRCNGPTMPSTVRFVVPGPSSRDAVALNVPRTVGYVEYWDGTSWQRLDYKAYEKDLELLVPEAAWRDGEVVVRYGVSTSAISGIGGSNLDVTLRPRSAS